jgi:hypothetical protein
MSWNSVRIYVTDIIQRLSIKYTIGKDFIRATYIDQVISKLTHSLTTVLPEVIEEMTLAFEENTSIGPGSLSTPR